jgi:hypothetical protein
MTIKEQCRHRDANTRQEKLTEELTLRLHGTIHEFMEKESSQRNDEPMEGEICLAIIAAATNVAANTVAFFTIPFSDEGKKYIIDEAKEIFMVRLEDELTEIKNDLDTYDLFLNRNAKCET